MKQSGGNDNCCSISTCDIFDFMAQHVGLTVIHPGGFKATKKLATYLRINEHSKVIDIACGKGTTAFLLAEMYKCQVIGIDISENLIEEARYLNKRKGLEKKVTFEIGDATKLPYSDNEFDIAISQAMLILVKNKIQAIRETNRILKKGGSGGWIELSWKKAINPQFFDEVSHVLCAYCMTNVCTYDEWQKIFEEAGILDIKIEKENESRSNYLGTIRDEGLRNTCRIMFHTIVNKEIRDRIKLMNQFFKSHNDYFGFGIFHYQK